jgi:hypothetical protein
VAALHRPHPRLGDFGDVPLYIALAAVEDAVGGGRLEPAQNGVEEAQQANTQARGQGEVSHEDASSRMKSLIAGQVLGEARIRVMPIGGQIFLDERHPQHQPATVELQSPG